MRRQVVLLDISRSDGHETAYAEPPARPVSAPRQVELAGDLHLLKLSPIERHVLARVTVHCHTHDGCIPFVPPTTHMAHVAHELASDNRQLLLEVGAPATLRRSYQLSARGEQVVRREFAMVSEDESQRREIQFNLMRKLMCALWEQCA